MALTELKAAFEQCAKARPLGEAAPIDALEGVLKTRRTGAQQAEAASEEKAREALDSVKNNVAVLKQKLVDPAVARFSTKKWFLDYRSYVDANDPLKRLDRVLELYKVWFGTRDESDSIIDPNTSKRAVKQPKGIDLPYCYNLVSELRKAYNGQNALTPGREQYLKAIEKKIDGWQ